MELRLGHHSVEDTKINIHISIDMNPATHLVAVSLYKDAFTTMLQKQNGQLNP